MTNTNCYEALKKEYKETREEEEEIVYHLYLQRISKIKDGAEIDRLTVRKAIVTERAERLFNQIRKLERESESRASLSSADLLLERNMGGSDSACSRR